MNKLLRFLSAVGKKIYSFFPWYANLYRGRAWYTKGMLGIMSFIVAIFLYLGAVDINFLWLFGKSPGFSDIMTPPTYAASEIYSADGVLIGKFFKENRTPVKCQKTSLMLLLILRMNVFIIIMVSTLWA